MQLGSTMNWDDLRIVGAVYRTGSYMRAGREMAIDETTVARRIARIEASLGMRLFETLDGLRNPTESCKAILPALAAMERAASDVQTLTTEAGQPVRRLRLSTISAIAEHFVAPAVGRLLTAEPGLTLVVETGDHNVDMSRWEADLAIRLGRPARGAFNVRRVGVLDFCLVMPRGGGIGAAAGADVASVPSSLMPLIAYTDSLSGTPEMGCLFRFERAGPVRVQTSDVALIRALVEAGAGIGVLPGFLAESLRRDDRLDVHPIEAQREVWLLTQSHARDDPLACRVADWCAGLFERLSPA